MSDYIQNNTKLNADEARTLDQLLHKMHRHGRPLQKQEIEHFGTLGVPTNALTSTCPVLVDRVIFDDDHFFFAGEATGRREYAYTFGVFGAYGLVNIAAWHPETGRLATWLDGEGFALGEPNIRYSEPSVQGLNVFRDPLEWLRAERCGIVILDFAAAKFELAESPAIVAQDERHRKYLEERLLTAGRKIVVNTSRSEATDE